MRSLRRVLLSLAMLPFATLPGVAQSGSFGNAIVVSDGELIIAEPNTNFRPGAVYIYRRSGNAWREAAQLHAPDSERADGFGSVLARTGNTLFVGQRNGPLHVFERHRHWGRGGRHRPGV